MSFDDRIGAALATTPADPWPDPVARIEAGVHRRMVRRRVVAVAAVVLGAVLLPTVLVGRSAPTPATLGWSAEAAPAVHIQRREPRPVAQPCVGADFAGGLAWSDPSVRRGGSTLITLLVANKRENVCTVGGLPSVSVGGGGLALRRHGSAESAYAQYPATVGAGEPARVTVAQPTDCVRRSGQLRPVQVGVAGVVLAATQLRLARDCPVTVSDWWVEPPMINGDRLVATIHAPAQVVRGTTMTYTVAVRNDSGDDLSLRDCPGFLQGIGAQSRTYRLIGGRAWVRAHTTRTVTMVLAVPADSPLGESRLHWTLVLPDGEVVVADLAAGGVPVVVTAAG